MRVLMLTRGFAPYIDNGRDKYVSELSKSLAKTDNIIHVVTPLGGMNQIEGQHDEEWSDTHIHTESIHNIFIHQFKYPYTYSLPKQSRPSLILLQNLGMVETVITNIRQDEIDVIHAHDAQVGIAANILSKYFKAPIVYSIHWLHHRLHKSGFSFEAFMEKHVVSMASSIICVSKSVAEEVYHLYTRKNVNIIYGGASEDSLRQESVNTTFDVSGLTNKRVILYVGRILYEKGLFDLIDAFNAVKNEFSDLSLVIVGSGPAENELTGRIEEYGIDERVIMTGFLAGKELIKAYQLAEVIVIPSHFEAGFALVAIEAMIFGVPIIASNVGGLSEGIDDGNDGLLYPAGDINSLRIKLSELLIDKELQRKLSNNSKMKAQLFTWDNIAENTIKVYKSARTSYRQIQYQLKND